MTPSDREKLRRQHAQKLHLRRAKQNQRDAKAAVRHEAGRAGLSGAMKAMWGRVLTGLSNREPA